MDGTGWLLCEGRVGPECVTSTPHWGVGPPAGWRTGRVWVPPSQVTEPTHQSCTAAKEPSFVTSYIRMKPMAPR